MVKPVKKNHKVTIINGEIYRYEDLEGVRKSGIATLKSTAENMGAEKQSQCILTYIDELQQLNSMLICLSFLLILGCVTLTIKLRRLRTRWSPVYQATSESKNKV